MALDDIGIDKQGKEGLFPSVYQELINIFDETVNELKESLDAKGIDNTTELQASINFNPEILGDTFKFQLKLADYYKWVDEGRKPGKFPPLAPILAWMRQKGIVPRNKKGERTITNDKTLKSFAYVIAKAISKKGTIKRFGYKGSGFYSSVIPSAKEFASGVSKRIATSAKKDILVQIKTF